LALLSIFSGWYLKDLMTLHAPFYGFMLSPLSDTAIDQDFVRDMFKVAPSVIGLYGIFYVYEVCWLYKLWYQQEFRTYVVGIYLSCKRFFVDAFNSLYIFLPTASFSLSVTYKTIDQGVLELAGSTGSYNLLESLFSKLKHIEMTLFIYRLLLLSIFSLVVLITSFVCLGKMVILSLLLAILTLHDIVQKSA
jgi:hypothetical protein